MGDNNYGQLGDGTTIRRLTPVKVGERGVAVAAGGSHSLFVMSCLPRITDDPLSQSGVAGRDLVLSGGATGVAPLSYQWWKDGVLVPGWTNGSIVVTNAGVLDSGGYALVVSNPWGAVTSQVAAVRVSIPPVITQHPVSLTVMAGTNATFSVGVTGTAPMLYQWRKNGLDMAGATGEQLTLTNVGSLDGAGYYDVVVANGGGVVTSRVATLTVKMLLAIVTQPSSRAVLANQNKMFHIHI